MATPCKMKSPRSVGCQIASAYQSVTRIQRLLVVPS
jgi:hypothetical protein